MHFREKKKGKSFCLYLAFVRLGSYEHSLIPVALTHMKNLFCQVA